MKQCLCVWEVCNLCLPAYNTNGNNEITKTSRCLDGELMHAVVSLHMNKTVGSFNLIRLPNCEMSMLLNFKSRKRG